MRKTVLLLASLMFLFACEPIGQEQNDDNNTGDPNGQVSGEPDFSPESWYEVNYWERSDREKAGLRGPVKKWYLSKSSSHREYTYNEAGNITLIRDVNPESTRGEWMEQRFYDDKGRLVKSLYGRSTQKGGMDFDEWSSLESWTYEYNNPGKYVMTASSLSSKYPFRHLSPESYAEHNVETIGDFIIKDLSAVRCTQLSTMSMESREHFDYEYTFGSDGNLTARYHNYYTAYDIETGEEGDILGEKDGYQEWSTDYLIEYKDGYPYAIDYTVDGRTLYQITSMTWRDNGMPLKMEGMEGISQFDPNEKRYICMTRWDCQPGNPGDALFVFTYWETYKYNEHGDLIEIQERFNEESDNPWTRPTTFTFEYDAHGNWIKYDEKYMIAADGPDSPVKDGSLTREIAYY